MSGGPVANATVTFAPKQKQPVAVGKTNTDGQFTLMTYDPGDGAAEGEFVVLVMKTVEQPPASTAHDSKNPFDSSAAHSQATTNKANEGGLPAKYSKTDKSDLVVKVEKGGKNEFNLDLTP